jgi:hypothetical protein
MKLLLLSTLIGCGSKDQPADSEIGPAPSGTADQADTDDTFDPGDGDPGDDDSSGAPPELNGEWIDPPLAAVLGFEATNRDGQARGPEHFLGQPTVVWFYPFAGSPG